MTADARAAALVAYDGARFHGWQRHPGRPTAQGALEEAVSAALGAPTRVEGAGRTDRGAHARGQVASFDLPPGVDAGSLAGALRCPAGLEVREVVAAPPGFHARESAVGKTYRYALWLRDEGGPDAPADAWSVGGVHDLEGMRAALASLVGTHDFATFASQTRHAPRSTVRTLRRADLAADGPLVRITLEADGFLYKMVRNLVRAVVKVGEGREEPLHVADQLGARDRRAATGSAPASGLTLVRVLYDPPLFAAEADA